MAEAIRRRDSYCHSRLRAGLNWTEPRVCVAWPISRDTL